MKWHLRCTGRPEARERHCETQKCFIQKLYQGTYMTYIHTYMYMVATICLEMHMILYAYIIQHYYTVMCTQVFINTYLEGMHYKKADQHCF